MNKLVPNRKTDKHKSINKMIEKGTNDRDQLGFVTETTKLVNKL